MPPPYAFGVYCESAGAVTVLRAADLLEFPPVGETQQSVSIGQFLWKRIEGTGELQDVHGGLVELCRAARVDDGG